jgi:Flp pilus assembly protein TadG
MKKLRLFRRNERGATAVEFALVTPVFFGMLIGITQLGTLYFAGADLRNSVAAGARKAQIFPRPGAGAVRAAVRNKIYKLNSAYLTGPTVTQGTDANGYAFYLIEASYAVPLNFVFFKTPPVTLTESRRVYLSPTS